ncbi:hypothetical protein IWQ62_000341 [Dispira parvispora]|uniref:Ribosome assembly protein 3 n=1 Tax=Dispira parvispora TaxID=1520584 RepID=A0A9W8AW42_9FUNG|nr:hypothetical protein IWQ62_000341 [Dispira parvispora]
MPKRSRKKEAKAPVSQDVEMGDQSTPQDATNNLESSTHLSESGDLSSGPESDSDEPLDFATFDDDNETTLETDPSVAGGVIGQILAQLRQLNITFGDTFKNTPGIQRQIRDANHILLALHNVPRISQRGHLAAYYQGLQPQLQELAQWLESSNSVHQDDEHSVYIFQGQLSTKLGKLTQEARLVLPASFTQDMVNSSEVKKDMDDSARKQFRNYYMTQLTEAFGEDLDELRKSEELTQESLSMLIENLEAGILVFDDKDLLAATRLEEQRRVNKQTANK